MSSSHDVIVIGAGISGMSAAFYAARAGHRCLVLEKATTLGGAIHTARTSDGFWYELGAHTLYNSYGSLLDLLTTCNLREAVLERTKAPYRMLVDGRIRSIPSQLAVGELFASAWRAFTEQKSGKSGWWESAIGSRSFLPSCPRFLRSSPTIFRPRCFSRSARGERISRARSA